MSSFGLTEAGFVPKTLNDVKTSLEAKMRALLGASLDVSAKSLWGQVIGVFSGEMADCWEAEEESQSSLDPDASIGVPLVSLSGLTGTLPEGAISSSVVETLVGTAGTLLPAGRIVSVTGRTDSRFLTQVDATIAAVAAWATAHSYAGGDRVTNGSPAKVYQATQGGVSAGSGGPTTTSTAIVDNTVVWRYLGNGNGAIDVLALSEKLDAVTAPSGTLTRIDSPVVGLNAAYNFLDANIGRADETDPELRARREVELRAEGNAALDAIRARVDRVDGVKTVVVFENTTTATVDGMPPKSVEVVVQLDAGPPADVEDALRAAVFGSVAGGVQPFGQVTGAVIDASGNSQTVGFTYLADVVAYVRLDLDVTADFPADGIDQVKTALLEYEAQKLVGGYDLVAFQLGAKALDSVPGIFDVTNAKVGTSSPATLTRVSISSRQTAALDTSRMTIATNLVTT